MFYPVSVIHMLLAKRFEPTRKYSVSPQVQRGVRRFKDKMREGEIYLDVPAAFDCASLVTNATSRHVAGFLRERNLSLTCHVVNGFGDFTSDSSTGLRELIRYCRTERNGCTSLPQQDGHTTDFHPFQTFTYALMGGIRPEQLLSDGETTLTDLAMASRKIHIDRIGYQDLGHFMFAVAYLQLDPDLTFMVNEHKLTVKQLIELGLIAHSDASEEPSVCSAFHLTEGLCAAAAKIPAMTHLLDEAQELLDRQLALLQFIGAMIHDSNENRCPNIEMAIELGLINPAKLIFLAGHLLELAAFAELLGYQLTLEQRNTIRYVANELNRDFADVLRYMYTSDFSFVCHFRRAITLLAEIELAKQEGRDLDTVDLSSYRADFDIAHSDYGFRTSMVGEVVFFGIENLALIGSLLRSLRYR